MVETNADVRTALEIGLARRDGSNAGDRVRGPSNAGDRVRGPSKQ
jgi:hypothetical protein